MVKRINRLISHNQIGPGGGERLRNCFKDMDVVLNIFDFSKKTEYSDAVNALIKERETARLKRDWETADRIREQLDGMGVCVHDKKV